MMFGLTAMDAGREGSLFTTGTRMRKEEFQRAVE